MEDCDNRKNDFDENNPDYDPLQLAGASLQDCRNTSVQEEFSKNTFGRLIIIYSIRLPI